MYEKKLQDMENQQKVLENNLKKFLDLKRELSFLQHEAEESDRVVNDFIKVKLTKNLQLVVTKEFPRPSSRTFQLSQEQIKARSVGRLVTPWRISAHFKVSS